MPEMSAGQRGNGGWVSRTVSPGRHYTPDLLGGLCEVCRTSIPAALDVSVHPACDPRMPELLGRDKIRVARNRRAREDG